MLKSGFDVQADILHLEHHGSETSTHLVFLKKVNPSVAVYSAGINNRYGHPHPEVVHLVQNSGIQLYGTDVHGTIVVSTDGKSYNISTEKDGVIMAKKDDSTTSQNKSGNYKEPVRSGNSCIDINKVSAEELQEIIHIGPERAAQLIELRPYRSIDDLSRIDGIGPSRVKDIKAQGLAFIGGK